MSTVLELTNLVRAYAGSAGDILAVDDISLKVETGEFTAVVGPSGCGKSTLLLCAGGLLKPTSGQVTVEGVNPYELNGDQRARLRGRSIGFVFQQFHLVPFLTVHENVMAARLSMEESHRDADRSRADELIARFGLTSRSNHLPGKLSSGERQRTALARALMNQPSLLLADEPTGNLDRENAAIVVKHLREFATAGGAVLLVTHDEQAVEHADRVFRLSEGRLVSAEPLPAG